MSAEVTRGHPYLLLCYFWFIYCIKFRDFTWYKWITCNFVLILPFESVVAGGFGKTQVHSLSSAFRNICWLCLVSCSPTPPPTLSLAAQNFSSRVLPGFFLWLDQHLFWPCHTADLSLEDFTWLDVLLSILQSSEIFFLAICAHTFRASPSISCWLFCALEFSFLCTEAFLCWSNLWSPWRIAFVSIFPLSCWCWRFKIMAQTSLPPGFRFHPTDVELCSYYLKRKIMGKKLLVDAIAEVELYKFAPWDLPGNYFTLMFCFLYK
jgi:hypothetical protein